MNLRNLLQDVEYECLRGSLDQEITALVYDSRKVEKGSAFVCLKGARFDGHAYAAQAVQDGAVALIVEEEIEFSPKSQEGSAENGGALALDEDVAKGVAVIRVKNTREALAYLSRNWFGNPAAKLKVIGLTGTKGKTTTTHMIKKILEEEGYKVGMIGTLGAFIGQEKYPTKNTTPESYELHKLFAKMLQEGCQFAVMEVSSQAMKLGRAAGIEFAYGAFLNITPDHISPDEHKDFQEYLDCKKLLFKQTGPVVVNIDDPHWQEATEFAKDRLIKVSCQKENAGEADYAAGDISNLWESGHIGVSFTLNGSSERIFVNVPGHFNVENALIAIALTKDLGIPEKSILAGLAKVTVKGRTQLLPYTNGHTTMLIDYAHNAVSMENLLSMLKAYKPSRLICLFGGGGNRAKARRYDMGLAAGKYADLTVLTMDNPRDEEVEEINKTIIEGLEVHHGKYITIIDREEAIHYLIDHAQPGDIIALIGKGHEEYQEIKGQKYYFSEEKIVEEYCKVKYGG